VLYLEKCHLHTYLMVILHYRDLRRIFIISLHWRSWQREQKYSARKEAAMNQVTIHATLDIEFIFYVAKVCITFHFHAAVSQLYTSLTDNLMTNLIVTTLLIFGSADFRDRCAISYQKKIFRRNTHRALARCVFNNIWFIRMIRTTRQIR